MIFMHVKVCSLQCTTAMSATTTTTIFISALVRFFSIYHRFSDRVLTMELLHSAFVNISTGWHSLNKALHNARIWIRRRVCCWYMERSVWVSIHMNWRTSFDTFQRDHYFSHEMEYINRNYVCYTLEDRFWAFKMFYSVVIDRWTILCIFLKCKIHFTSF